MENITEYIDVLIQAPIAVILIVFIYLIMKFQTTFVTTIIRNQNDMFVKISQALNEAIKIIKQIKRK